MTDILILGANGQIARVAINLFLEQSVVQVRFRNQGANPWFAEISPCSGRGRE